MATEAQLAEIRVQNDGVFLLLGDLDFTSVPMLLSKVTTLLKPLSENANAARYIDLNLENVTQCNSAGIAFLLELNRLCHTMGKSLRIKNMSTQMDVIARVHGVTEPLKALQS